MDKLITIIFIILIILMLAKAFKNLFICALFAILTFTIYTIIQLPYITSVILSIVIFKGFKDTLFNLNVTFKALFKSKYKFEQRFLGKLVNILFELNFTIFIFLCYLLLISYVPYSLDIDSEFMAITFISISLIQILKQLAFRRTYYHTHRFLR
ncbi:hypothetical protein EAI30_06970 [Romboutsia ilealis]|uniref:Uncharacterized protein n=1 Tax=Romboutsia faecis TaxID=2764597 RepID=A0ABR7JKF0_9FIRM|nr:hypothetical protein [Romboutsia faecis]MBC5995404.1 hypothetical protein [Romboutsia faecis]MRN24354.1 hypothetical protein [Romboutsia ilealis]